MSEAPASISIRRAKPEDLKRILQIERESFQYPYDVSIFLRALMNRGGAILVAEIENKVVGYVMFNVTGEKGIVTSIAVDPADRERGIGSSLLLRALEEMREKAKIVEIEVSVNNERAKELYIRHGFRPVGIIKNYYPTGDDAILMRKNFP